MTKAIFQIMGGFALFFAALLAGGGIFTTMHYPPRSRLDLMPMASLVVALALAGFGLFYLRKWAALLVSLMAICVASWEVKDAIHPVPGDANWLGFFFALLLVVPSILTVRYWRTLTWRGRQTTLAGEESKTRQVKR